ncbi:MAG: hypothetical protein ACYSU0_00995, partial [Planctomycetota bacterium]
MHPLTSDPDVASIRKGLERIATVTNVRLCQTVTLLAAVLFAVGLAYPGWQGQPDEIGMGVFLAGIGLMFAAVFIPLALFLNGARILLVFVNGLEKANEN